MKRKNTKNNLPVCSCPPHDCEMHEIYKKIIESSKDFIFVVSKDFRVVYLNKFAAAATPFSQKEVVGKKLDNIFTPDICRRLKLSITGVIKKKKVKIFEEKLIVPPGREIYIHTQLVPLRNGDVRAIMGISRDITKHHKTEESVKQEKEFSQTLLNSMPMGVDIVDENLRINFLNKPFLAKFGKRAIGKKCYEVYKDNKKRCAICPLRKPLKVGEVRTVEVGGVAGGKIFSIAHTGILLPGGKKATLEVFSDITERKKAENRDRMLGRIIKTIAYINQFLIKGGTDKKNIYREACEAVVKHGGFKMAWFGLANFETHEVYPVAEFGFSRIYLKSLKVRCDDSPSGRGPTGTAIRTGRHFILDDINRPKFALWKADAERAGFVASAAFPIRMYGKVIGALNIYTDEAEMFTTEVVALLDELTADVSFMLQTVDEGEKRIKALADLGLSEHRFRELFDNMDECVAVYEVKNKGKDIIIKDFNRAAEKLENVRREDIIGKKVDDIFKGVRALGLFGVFKKVWKTGRAMHHPVNLYKDRNRQGWRDNFVFKLPSGEVVAIYADVTDKREAAEMIRKSEEKLKFYINNMPAVFWATGAGFKNIFVTANVKKLTGYTAEEWKKLGPASFLKRIHKKDIPKLREIYRFLQNSKNIKDDNRKIIENVEFYFKRRDGRWIWLDCRMKLVQNGGGRIQVEGFLMDITKQKELAEKLKESEDKYSKIVEGGNDGIVIIQDRKIKFANVTMEKMLGFSIKEAIGKPFINYVAPEWRNKILKIYLARLLGRKVPNRYEFGLLKKNNGYTPVETNSSIIEYKGRPAVMAILRDMTEWKELDRLKSEFISVASHQLRTPLTTIKWSADIFLKNNKSLSEEEKGLLAQIFKSNERMIKLVNDLLSVSRIETGRKVISPQKNVDVVSMVRTVIMEQSNIAQTKGIAIVCAPHKLPKMQIDPDKIRMVFENILSNAIKYSKIGGRVEFDCKEKDDEIIFIMEDHGIGIPSEQQKRIFEKFFRGDNVDPDAAGTGLGLYIAKFIVEAHGGKIWFKSKLNKGTTFFISLPIKINKNL